LILFDSIQFMTATKQLIAGYFTPAADVPSPQDTKVSARKETDGGAGGSAARIDMKMSPVRELAATPGLALKRLLHKMPRGKGFKPGVSEVRTSVWYNYAAFTVVGGAALSFSNYIALGDVPEIKNEWSALYDEVKLHGGTVHWNLQGTAFSGVPPGGAAICYDPIDTTAPTSLTDVLEHSQSQLVACPGNNYYPVAHTKTGFWTFTFKVHPVSGIEVSSTPTTVPTNAPGMWHDMKQSGTPAGTADGSLKFFAENAGSNAWTMQPIVRFDVSFRSRT